MREKLSVLYGHEPRALNRKRQLQVHLREALVGKVRPVRTGLVPALAVGLTLGLDEVLTPAPRLAEREAAGRQAPLDVHADGPPQPRVLRPPREAAEVEVAVLAAAGAGPSLIKVAKLSLSRNVSPEQPKLVPREMTGFVWVVKTEYLPERLKVWLKATLETDEAIAVATISRMRKLLEMLWVPPVAGVAKFAGLQLRGLCQAAAPSRGLRARPHERI
mmetsp:Transcript_107592/g.304305  ORF Transcript_107592/g.304305 Transcript_107592/m.304305 type:complete len:218 (+) Transcript_107592:893-1546(+)